MRVRFALLFAAFVGQATAQDLKPYYNANEQGVWLDGYDPVAYLIQGRAMKGSAELSLVHDGTTFRFANATHLDLFRKQPERYIPKYGGWCAYALGARNEKVGVDPGTFKVIDGEVYLFYNAYFNNTLTSWNKDEAHLHQAADRNWNGFKHKH